MYRVRIVIERNLAYRDNGYDFWEPTEDDIARYTTSPDDAREVLRTLVKVAEDNTKEHANA